MRTAKLLSAFLLLVSVMAASSQSQNAVMKAVEVRVGSSERKAILDSLRKRVVAELGTPVIFKVSFIRRCGDWTLVLATPVHPNGKAIDLAKTKLRKEYLENPGLYDDGIQAALEKAGGKWHVRFYYSWATDYALEDWETLRQIRVPVSVLRGFGISPPQQRERHVSGLPPLSGPLKTRYFLILV